MARRSSGRFIPNLIVTVFMVVSFVIVLGFLVLYVRQQYRQADYHPETGCRHDGQYDRTAVLIDGGDPLSATQIKGVREHVEDRLRLEPDEWIGLYVLDEDSLMLPEPMQLCNSGSTEKANPLYALFESDEKIRRRFIERVQPMVEEVERLTAENIGEQSTSPILDMVRAVAEDRNYRSSGHRRLVIASDMLQDTPEYSHLSGRHDFESFRNNPYSNDFLNLSLRGVEVQILYLMRTQTEELQERRWGVPWFWEQYFNAVHATVVLVDPLR